MTNYSNNPGKVRVDFFKPSGKWYETEELDMSAYYGEPVIHNAILKAYYEQIAPYHEDMTMVVLEPYHQFSHPIMFTDLRGALGHLINKLHNGQ